ncbi:transglutaminaseTgpA domain-containing protein [uncultured Arenimonas sp.]|uniref:DUF3488 domain-containing protein n=1 Tax=uncultured Arenimonas sp. TaxID=546226 RepID=UPI0030D7BCD4
MADPLPTPLRRWCMAAAGACLLPLLLQVPAGLAFALGGIAGLGYVFDRRWPGLLRMAVVVMVMGYLLFTFGFNLGRDTGTALLATLLAVKPGETRTLRDARSLLGFSLFAPFAAFLQDQGPLVLLLAMLALGLLLVGLAMLAEHRPLARWRSHCRWRWPRSGCSRACRRRYGACPKTCWARAGWAKA